MKTILIIFSIGYLILASGCHAPNALGQAQYVYKSVGGRKLTLDFDYPLDWKPSDNRPAIVFFFGGGWSETNLPQFKPQAEYFARRGLVCARADFRLLVRDRVWPDKCVEDAISAMRWVRAHAAQLGVDPSRIVAAGASSGGHLAACTFFAEGISAADDDKSVSPKPNAMILYNPALNLVALRSTGGAPFFAGLDDAMLKRISPSLHVRKETPPTLIIDGTADELCPQIREFVEKSKSVAAPVEAAYTEGQPHAFFDKSPWLEKTTREADDFLCHIGYLRHESRVPLPSRANW